MNTNKNRSLVETEVNLGTLALDLFMVCRGSIKTTFYAGLTLTSLGFFGTGTDMSGLMTTVGAFTAYLASGLLLTYSVDNVSSQLDQFSNNKKTYQQQKIAAKDKKRAAGHLSLEETVQGDLSIIDATEGRISLYHQ